MKELIQKLMEKLDIKVDEEFYLLEFDDFKKGWGKSSNYKYHFNNDLKVVNAKDQSKNSILGGLITEKFKPLKVEKPKTVWDLKEGDFYYFLNILGDVCYCCWNGYEFDLARRSLGNAFLTKEEAEFEKERKECESIILKYGRRTFKHEKNYCIESYKKDDIEEIYVACYRDLQNQGSIYFDTEELAKKTIDEVGKERLKKYVFRVEE